MSRKRRDSLGEVKPRARWAKECKLVSASGHLVLHPGHLLPWQVRVRLFYRS
jgi:hypothetical protein